MSTKGIRISDLKNGKCIPLSEILADISNANQLNWALLWLDATPIKKEGKMITELQKKVNQFEHVFFCSYEELIEIAIKIFQEIEVLIIASRMKEHLSRYDEDQKMHENCDIVIEMIDGSFWEIFSKNIDWIDKLARKYKRVDFLPPDFHK